MDQSFDLWCVLEGRNYIEHKEITEVDKRNQFMMGPLSLDWHADLGCYGIHFDHHRMAQVWNFIREYKELLLGHQRCVLPAFAVVEFRIMDGHGNLLTTKAADVRTDIGLPNASFIWPGITPAFLEECKVKVLEAKAKAADLLNA